MHPRFGMKLLTLTMTLGESHNSPQIAQLICQYPQSSNTFKYFIVHCRILLIIPHPMTCNGILLHALRAKAKSFIQGISISHTCFQSCAISSIALHCLQVPFHRIQACTGQQTSNPSTKCISKWVITSKSACGNYFLCMHKVMVVSSRNSINSYGSMVFAHKRLNI